MNGSEKQTIQWFPGHMVKTEKQIQKNLKLADAVVEILDARIPLSSHNPQLGRLIGSKPRIILMNKEDLADSKQTALWLNCFQKRGWGAFSADCKSGKGIGSLFSQSERLLSAKMESWKEKGMTGKRIRLMAVGIPNVGKSSLINRLAHGSRAAVENRPGVTRTSQWFQIGKSFEMMDTPGVLWPKISSRKAGEHLAFTGAVKESTYDVEPIACQLLETLRQIAPDNLKERYRIDEDIDEMDGFGMLKLIGRKRGMLSVGGVVNTERAAHMLLDEFRSAKIGRITLEPLKP